MANSSEMPEQADSLCPTCLAAGRALHTLGERKAAVLKFLVPVLLSEMVAVCWECEAALRRSCRFQENAREAQLALKKYHETKTFAASSLITSSRLKISAMMVTENVLTCGSIKPEIPEAPSLPPSPDTVKIEPDGSGVDFVPADYNSTDSDSEPLEAVKKKRNGGACRYKVLDRTAKKVPAKKKVKKKRKIPESYSCKECGKEFKTRGTFEYHKESHREKPQCEDCGRTFVSKSTLWTHRQLVHLDKQKWFCEVCGKVFFTEAGHAAHAGSHRDGDDRFFCHPCGKFFKTNSSYRKHRRSSVKHVDPGGLRFGCSACERRFPTDERARQHYDVIHLQRNKFACKQCPRQYCTARALRIHERVKHERVSQPRDKVCELCGKGFRTSQVLKSHIRTHTGERPYGCRLCPSTFTQNGALHTHTRLVHLNMKRGKKKQEQQGL